MKITKTELEQAQADYGSPIVYDLDRAKDLLMKARDALYMLEKDEDRGIAKEEKKLVEEIDAYFGVLTPEHQGKRTFRLKEK